VDNVGNTATAGPITGNKVDRKAPAGSMACPSAVLLNSTASATLGSVTDGGSGVATDSAQNGHTVALSTGMVGSQQSGTLTLKDEVGNTGSATTCLYSVVYNSSPTLRSPISGSWKTGSDSTTVLNRVKAGSSVPVKFSLGGFSGLTLGSGGVTVASGAVHAPSNPEVDPMTTDEVASPGSSGLKYDATADEYTLVWKTDSAWRGTRRLIVTLNDGTQYRATFDFVK
jgi:hypothetical protein